jgi:hypothetical protein
MENLHLKEQRDIYFSPEVNFNAETGVCEVAGESYLEDAFLFYEILQNWIDAYEGNTIFFKFKLTYFNTSSSKGVLNVIKALRRKFDEGKDVTVIWYYPQENQDLLMEGEDFMCDVDMQFSFVPYQFE